MRQPEQQPDNQEPLEPTQEDQREQSFGTAMRQAVDDLFTYEPIAEKLRELKEDERIQVLIERRKQALVDALEEQGWRSVDDVLAELEHFQKNPDELASLGFDKRNDVGSEWTDFKIPPP